MNHWHYVPMILFSIYTESVGSLFYSVIWSISQDITRQSIYSTGIGNQNTIKPNSNHWIYWSNVSEYGWGGTYRSRVIQIHLYRLYKPASALLMTYASCRLQAFYKRYTHMGSLRSSSWQPAWSVSSPTIVYCFYNFEASPHKTCKFQLSQVCYVCLLPETHQPPMPSWRKHFILEKNCYQTCANRVTDSSNIFIHSIIICIFYTHLNHQNIL